MTTPSRDWKKSPSTVTGKVEWASDDGPPPDPREVIVPLIRRTEGRRYEVTGTGFFITVYGLVATACHVLDEFVTGGGFALQAARGDTSVAYHRRLRAVTRNQQFDVGVAQVDNAMDDAPDRWLRNRVPILSTDILEAGSSLSTFVYPESQFDLDGDPVPMLQTVSLQGVVKRIAMGDGPDDNPRIRYPHYETNMLIPSGASGGPVFDERGRVVGINCSGMDFGEDPGPEGEHSYVIPIACLLHVRLTGSIQVNNESRSYPLFGGDPHREEGWSIPELASLGHITFDPPLEETPFSRGS